MSYKVSSCASRSDNDCRVFTRTFPVKHRPKSFFRNARDPRSSEPAQYVVNGVTREIVAGYR